MSYGQLYNITNNQRTIFSIQKIDNMCLNKDTVVKSNNLIFENIQLKYEFVELQYNIKTVEDLEKYLYEKFIYDIKYIINKLRHKGIDIYQINDNNINTINYHYDEFYDKKYIIFKYEYGINELHIYTKLFVNGVTDNAIDNAIKYGINKITKQLNNEFKSIY